MGRYVILSLEGFRTTDGQARKYFFGDLRITGEISFLDMGLVLELCRHIPPRDQKIGKEHPLY